jgi:hypothetical protein
MGATPEGQIIQRPSQLVKHPNNAQNPQKKANEKRTLVTSPVNDI